MLTWDTVSLVSVSACVQKRFGQSQRASVSCWVLCWGSFPQSDPQWAYGWVLPGREVEKVLSKALNITQCGMIKSRRSYGSIWQSVFVSLRLRLSLSFSQPVTTPFERNKDNYIFITKCYSHSSFVYIHSLWLYDKKRSGPPSRHFDLLHAIANWKLFRQLPIECNTCLYITVQLFNHIDKNWRAIGFPKNYLKCFTIDCIKSLRSVNENLIKKPLLFEAFFFSEFVKQKSSGRL